MLLAFKKKKNDNNNPVEKPRGYLRFINLNIQLILIYFIIYFIRNISNTYLELFKKRISC